MYPLFGVVVIVTAPIASSLYSTVTAPYTHALRKADTPISTVPIPLSV